MVIGLEQTQIDSLPQGMLGLTRTRDTAELAAWYTAADCLANPTLEDNMPMVNLRPWLVVPPLRCSRTGGCPEALDEKLRLCG